MPPHPFYIHSIPLTHSILSMPPQSFHPTHSAHPFHPIHFPHPFQPIHPIHSIPSLPPHPLPSSIPPHPSHLFHPSIPPHRFPSSIPPVHSTPFIPPHPFHLIFIPVHPFHLIHYTPFITPPSITPHPWPHPPTHPSINPFIHNHTSILSFPKLGQFPYGNNSWCGISCVVCWPVVFPVTDKSPPVSIPCQILSIFWSVSSLGSLCMNTTHQTLQTPVAFKIANTLRFIVISHQSDTEVLDWCLININLMVLTTTVGILDYETCCIVAADSADGVFSIT